MADTQALIERATSAFGNTERTNFNNRWQAVTSFCRPVDDQITRQDSKGSTRNVRRLVDIGIRSLNTFASGLSSSLTPKGTRFVTFKVQRDSEQDNETSRWLQDASKDVTDYIVNSNFFVETSKAFSDLGLIGTALTLAEPNSKRGVQYKTFLITKFAFLEDATGDIDTAFLKVSMTRRQVEQKFDISGLPDEMRAQFEDPEKSDEYVVLHNIIEPRKVYDNTSINPKDHKVASFWVLEENKILLEESGYVMFPGSLGRWNQATDEIYGRSPAMEVCATLNLINTMEYSKLRSAQRIANPQWLSPNDGSVRNLNNEDGGVVYYNAANPSGKPEQLIQRDIPQVIVETIKEKEKEVESAFFVPIFNPLAAASANPTATEVKERSFIASAELVPRINRVIDEYLRPLFLRTLQILIDSGKLAQPPEGFTLEDVSIVFESRAAKILESIEANDTSIFISTLAQVAVVDPSILDGVDFDAYRSLLASANAIPTSVLKSDYDIKQIRKQRAAQQEAQRQEQSQLEEAKVLSTTNQDSALGQMLSSA